MKLKGSVVLITGAAKRVGCVIAQELATAGAHLILHYYHSLREAEQLRTQLKRKHSIRVDLIQADLSDLAQVKKLALQAWALHKKIDVLINNASTFYPTPLGTVTAEQWSDLFDVNVRAPFFLSEALGLKMKKRKQGKVINIADWSALRPYTQYLPYCASKAALVAVSQGLALSLAPEVQVNTILPGPVMWPADLGPRVKVEVLKKTPLKRVGRPEDIARTVRFLIEGSDYMTGSLVHVDGGRHIY